MFQGFVKRIALRKSNMSELAKRKLNVVRESLATTDTHFSWSLLSFQELGDSTIAKPQCYRRV